MNKISRFWQELKRRNVVRQNTVYAATAFVILELVSIVGDPLKLPDWTLLFVIILLSIGFIISLITSWIYEINSEGYIEKTKPTNEIKDEEKPASLNNWKIASYISFVVIIGLLMINLFGKGKGIKTDESLEISIAVLPFINLNNTDELEYFSDGVTQEIIDELAQISSIVVSAFSTSYQYKNQTKPQNEIANELDVEYLLTGSYRLFEDDKRIKLSIDLINPFTKERIWNNTFDEELNEAQYIQLAIAKKVAENLNIELSIAEKDDLEEPNTNSGEAFRLYLQAKSENNKLSSEGFENGAGYLEEALKLDPNFSQAHTLLAWRYTVGASADLVPGIERSSYESVALATPFIEKAVENDPEGSDIFLERNEKSKALDYLEKGVANSDFGFAIFLSLFPNFRELKDESRFQEILNKIQSPGI